MRKIINISMLILICVGIVFGTWSDREHQKYIDRGFSPPQSDFCLYNIIQSFLMGIVSIWAGINLFIIPSGLTKLFNKPDSPLQKFYQTFCVRIFGLMILALGLLSFWNIYAANLPNCRGP
jgi:ABC-type dipeptide/oligopeptide/nickel transport system permease component